MKPLLDPSDPPGRLNVSEEQGGKHDEECLWEDEEENTQVELEQRHERHFWGTNYF